MGTPTNMSSLPAAHIFCAGSRSSGCLLPSTLDALLNINCDQAIQRWFKLWELASSAMALPHLPLCHSPSLTLALLGGSVDSSPLSQARLHLKCHIVCCRILLHARTSGFQQAGHIAHKHDPTARANAQPELLNRAANAGEALAAMCNIHVGVITEMDLDLWRNL